MIDAFKAQRLIVDEGLAVEIVRLVKLEEISTGTNRPGSGAEFLQQRLRILQIGGVETLGKPAVDFREHRTKRITPALAIEQWREAESGGGPTAIALFTDMASI